LRGNLLIFGRPLGDLGYGIPEEKRTLLNIGSWWNSNEEIDLVVLGETGAMLAECKWSSKPVGSDILANKWESPPAPLDKGGAEGLAAMPSGADPLDEGEKIPSPP
jgi:hypothetical protein